MANTAGYRLETVLRPGEKVCWAGRTTQLQRVLGILSLPGAVLLYLVIQVIFPSIGLEELLGLFATLAFAFLIHRKMRTGETIVTDQRILSFSGKAPQQFISLDTVEVVQVLDRLFYAYARLTLSSGLVKRVFIFGEIDDLLACLPSQVTAIRSPTASNAYATLAYSWVGLGFFGAAFGFVLGLVGFVVSAAVADGITDDRFWSMALVLGFFLGVPLTLGYLGALVGVHWACGNLKHSHSLDEAKTATVYGLSIDVAAPRGFPQCAKLLLAPYAARRLSKVYSQPVQIG